MGSYLVELYLPRSAAGGLRKATARLRAAAAELTREGTPVRHVRAIFVPEDEVCFHLFESRAAEDVGEASRRAGLAYERIVEGIELGARRPQQRRQGSANVAPSTRSHDSRVPRTEPSPR